MYETINQQTYFALGILGILLLVAFILIFSKSQERVVVKTKTIEKRKLPIAWVLNREGNALVPIREDIMNSGKVIKVRTIGTGCILIHRNVLEKIKFRYQNDKDGMDDVFFCTDAINLGYDIFVDTSIKCEHIYEERPMKWGEGDLKY